MDLENDCHLSFICWFIEKHQSVNSQHEILIQQNPKQDQQATLWIDSWAKYNLWTVKQANSKEFGTHHEMLIQQNSKQVQQATLWTNSWAKYNLWTVKWANSKEFGTHHEMLIQQNTNKINKLHFEMIVELNITYEQWSELIQNSLAPIMKC